MKNNQTAPAAVAAEEKAAAAAQKKANGAAKTVHPCAAQAWRADDNAADALVFCTPAPGWREGLPLGNGRTGALILGGVGDDRIVFNTEDFYACANRVPVPALSDLLPRVRELIAAGKNAEAERIYPEAFAARGGGGSVGKFLPPADLLVRLNVLAPYSRYERRLDLRGGEASVRWEEAGACMEKRYFLSRTANVFYMRVRCGRGVRAEVGLCPHDFADDVGIFGDKLGTDVSFSAKQCGGMLVARAEIGGAVRYFALAASCSFSYAGGDGGASALGVPEVPFRFPYIVMEGESAFTLRVSVAESESAAIAELHAVSEDYGEEFAATCAKNAEIYGQTDFSFGEEDARPVEYLLLDANRKAPSYALLEKAAKFGKYMLGASGVGGKYPPNLQGIWNGAYDPPWFAGYFMNENLPMCLWQALPGGMPEAMLSCFSLAEKLMGDFRENAQKLFGCRGIYVPVYFTPESGLLTDPQPHVIYWTAGAAWLSELFYDYYRFTGDGEFLRTRALPFMREAAAFYKDFLIEKGGRLSSVPSVSPENCPLGDFEGAGRVFVAEDAAMDIAAAKGLFRALAECGEAEYGALAEKLPPYRIGKNGALCEWLCERYQDNHRHRHLSHIYPFFPASEFSEGPLRDAAEKSVHLRESVGLDAQTGWSFSHLANIYARLGDGARAFGALENIARYCMLPNLFTTHNDWRNMGATLKLMWAGRAPFQADANMGITAAVYECFLYSNEHLVRVLPAVPAGMAQGYARGLRTRTKTVADLYFSGTAGRAEFTALQDTSFTAVFPGGVRREIALAAGEKIKLEFNRE